MEQDITKHPIYNDRFYKLKIDRFIADTDNAVRGWSTGGVPPFYSSNTRRRWYHLNYEWDQIGEALYNSKYSKEDVISYLKQLKAEQELNDLLDQ